MATEPATLPEPVWLRASDGNVGVVAISTDGNYIVAGTNNNIHLYQSNGQKPLWSYTSDSRVVSLVISDSNDYIVAGTFDHNVYLFDRDSSTPLWNYSTEGYVRSVAVSAEANYIVAGSGDGKVYFFIRNNSTPLWNYTTEGGIESVDISSDGSYIVAGSWDNRVYLFNQNSSTPIWNRTIGGYPAGGFVESVAISADGRYIVAGSYYSMVVLFERSGPTPLWTYTTEGYVPSVSISADGSYIAAGSKESGNYKIYLFGYDNPTPLWSYTIGENGPQPITDMSADGSYIVGGSWDGSVYLFERSSSTPLWSYNTGNKVRSVAVSGNGGDVVAGNGDNKIYHFSDGDDIVWEEADDFPTISWLHSWLQLMALVISISGIGLAVVVITDRAFLNISMKHAVSRLQVRIENLNNAGWPHGLEQKYLVPIHEIPSINRKNLRRSLKLVEKGIKTADIIEHTGATLESAHHAIDQAQKVGLKVDTSALDQASKEFMSHDYDEALASAEQTKKTIENLTELMRQSRTVYDKFNRQLIASANMVDTSILVELPKATKEALDAGDPKIALGYLKSAKNKLAKALTEWEPILTITFPTEFAVGAWERVNIIVRNDGRAHAQNVQISIDGLETKGIPTIDILRAGEKQTIETAIHFTEPGSVPIIIKILAERIYDAKELIVKQNEWIQVGQGPKGITTTTPTSPSSASLIILRETEMVRGYVRVKVAVTNEFGAVVTDAGLELIYDGKVLRLERIEPEYRLAGDKVLIGNLGVKERKTVSFYLDPQICTATYLDGTLTYKDTQGEIHMAKMRRKEVNVVCPIFFTKETANPAMLRNLVQNVLPYNDAKLYSLPKGLSLKEALSIARETLAGRDIQFVRELSEPTPFVGEAWFYGTTKVKGYQIAIRASVREETNSIEIFASAPSPEVLTGLLAELGHDLQERLQECGMLAQQITNITIKDSILNRSSLLLSGDTESTIEESVVSKGDIGKSVADEIRKLKELVDEGIITEQDFENQKEKILKN